MGALVVFGLIFFHTARIFDMGDFYVKNDSLSLEIQLLVIFVGLFGMPLLFLIAGMAVWYSLSKRTAGEFVVERFKRLFIPLVFGVVMIVPPQIWARVIFLNLPLEDRGLFFDLGSYLEVYPNFFKVTLNFLNFPFIIEAAPNQPYFQTAHLWFLVLLFVYSLILLPFFLYLRSPSRQKLLSNFGDFLGRPWMIFVFTIPLALIEAVLTAEAHFGGWNRYAYAVFIVYGFLIVSSKQARLSLQQHWKSAFLIAIITTIVYFTIGIIVWEVFELDPLTSFDIWSILLRLLQGISGWCWIVTIMGFIGYKSQQSKDLTIKTSDSEVKQSKSSRFQFVKNFRDPEVIDRIARYSNRAQLPIYVLHQTVIVIIGLFVVSWNLNLYIKFLIISFSSLAGTLILYDIFVKRTRFTRFLFGMKPE
jgi:hypothetical protein